MTKSLKLIQLRKTSSQDLSLLATRFSQSPTEPFHFVTLAISSVQPLENLTQSQNVLGWPPVRFSPDLPSQQSQADEQISSAASPFGVAIATGPTGPIFAGSGNQHTKADAPGDRRQRFNKAYDYVLLNAEAETSALFARECSLRGYDYLNCLWIPSASSIAKSRRSTGR